MDAREPLLGPEEDPRVGDAVDAITAVLTVPPDDLTAQRHRRALAAARRTQPTVLVRRAAATGAAAAALVGALAVGGALPGPAQQVVADLASRVGIELPQPTTDEVPPARPVDRDAPAAEERLADPDGTEPDREDDAPVTGRGATAATPAPRSTPATPPADVPGRPATEPSAPPTDVPADEHAPDRPAGPPADVPADERARVEHPPEEPPGRTGASPSAPPAADAPAGGEAGDDGHARSEAADAAPGSVRRAPAADRP